jgi:Flp pilus assembly protein TadD
MRGLSHISFVGALCACAAGLATAVAAPASAQGSYSPYDETPAAALARYVRALADDPKDFNSLIGAGRAALALGDTQAAAGFFARADAVNPQSPLPQAGMGAVQAANGDAKAAMPYFTRAQQLGASQAVLGCDRGLAYDLLGQLPGIAASIAVIAALESPESARTKARILGTAESPFADSGASMAIASVLSPLMARLSARRRRASSESAPASAAR